MCSQKKTQKMGSAMKVKKVPKTDDKYVYGDDVKPEKGNNTTPKEGKSNGSAQRSAMKPKDVACKY